MPIELDSLGGPIPDIRGEPMNLSSLRPRRRRAAPASRPAARAEPQVLRPEPAARRVELQVLRPEPQAIAEPPGRRPEPHMPRAKLQTLPPDQGTGPPHSLPTHCLDKSFSGRK